MPNQDISLLVSMIELLAQAEASPLSPETADPAESVNQAFEHCPEYLGAYQRAKALESAHAQPRTL